MGLKAREAYARAGASKGSIQRVVVLMPISEVELIDKWGGPAGMASRTAAIRHLLTKGLEAVAAAGRQKATTGQSA